MRIFCDANTEIRKVIMYSKQVTPFLLERVDSKIMITRKYVRYNIFYLIFLLYDCNIYLAKKSDYDSKWVNKNLKCQLQVFILQQFLIFLPSLILFPVINRKPVTIHKFPCKQ